MTPKSLAMLFGLVGLLMAACGGEDAIDPVGEADPTSVAAATAAPETGQPETGQPEDGDDVQDTGDSDTAEQTEPAETTKSADEGSGCADVAESELWPGLGERVPAEIADVVQQRTAVLTRPHPQTCTVLTVTDPVLPGSTVGAAAAASVVNESPYVRYDLFVYESGAAADAAMARDAIRDGLPALLPEGTGLQVSKVGQTLFVARSYLDDGNGPSDEAFTLLDHYSASIAGSE